MRRLFKWKAREQSSVEIDQEIQFSEDPFGSKLSDLYNFISSFDAYNRNASKVKESIRVVQRDYNVASRYGDAINNPEGYSSFWNKVNETVSELQRLCASIFSINAIKMQIGMHCDGLRQEVLSKLKVLGPKKKAG